MPSTAGSGHSNRHRSTRTNLELIALRINAGFSRDDLAAEIGVGRETIRLAEAGFVPTPRVQFAIASRLGKTPLDIWPIGQQRRPTVNQKKKAA